MPNVKTARRRAPHWLTIGLTIVTIVGVGPVTLGSLATGNLDDSGRFVLAVPIPVAVSVVRYAPATPVEPTLAQRVAASRLDARTLLDLFQQSDYREEDVRAGLRPVPRVMLASLPQDLAALDDIGARKAVFLKTMLPIVLMTNERVGRDRARLRDIHTQIQEGRTPSRPDRVWLAELAQRYGLVLGEAIDTAALLLRVDAVPPSLALAQAAEESGWGTSRFARKGNALFGQLTWSAAHDGIVPRNRIEGETHRFRAFDDLKGSVEAYIHNLNTHAAYREFRRQRASLRDQGKPLDGVRLAGGLLRYSERGPDYVQTIRTMIRANALTDFDNALLLAEDTTKPAPAR